MDGMKKKKINVVEYMLINGVRYQKY